MRESILRITRALARQSPWLLVLGSAGWMGALLMRRVTGDPSALANMEPQMWVGIVAIVIACSSLLALGGSDLRRSRRSLLVAVALTPLIGCAAYLAALPRRSVVVGNSLFGYTGMVAPLCFLSLLLVVVALTLRRRRDTGTIVLRVGVATTAMALVGVMGSWFPGSICWGMTSGFSASSFAIAVADSYGIRALCEVCAGLSCLIAFVAVRRDPCSSRWMLLGMGAWWCSHGLLDFAALWVAGPMHRGLPQVMASAELIEVVAGLGGFTLAACFVGHLLLAVRDGRTVVAWALLPLLLLATSPALAPDPRTGNPDTVLGLANAAFDKALFDPLTLTAAEGSDAAPSARSELSAIALLSPEALVILHHGRRVATGFGALARVHVTLVPDVRATVGDLRSAAHRLRFVSSLEVAWRANRLDELPRDTRWQWPFLERASRDLRARPVHLAPECNGEPCGLHPEFERTEATDAPDDMLLGEYLVQSEDDLVFFLPVHRQSGDRVLTTWGAEIPRDLMDTHLLPLESPWPPVWGALFAVGAFLLWLLRDLLAATLIRAALVSVPPAMFTGARTEVYPAWVPRERTDPYAVGAGDPYRRTPALIGVASCRVALATLGGRLTRAAPRAFAAAACWLLFAILAFAAWR